MEMYIYLRARIYIMNLREGIDKLYAKQCLIRTLLEITRIPSPSTMEQGMIAYASQVLSENGFYVSVDSNGNIMARRGYSDTFPLLNAHMDTTIQNSGATTRLVSPYYEIRNELYARMDAYDAPWMAIRKTRNLTKKEYAEINAKLGEFDKEHRDTVVKPLEKIPRQHQYTLIYPPNSWRPDHIQYNPQSDTIKSHGSKQQIGGDDKAGVGIILCLASMTDLEFKVLLTVGEEPPFDGIYGVKTIPPQFFEDVSYCLTLDR